MNPWPLVGTHQVAMILDVPPVSPGGSFPLRNFLASRSTFPYAVFCLTSNRRKKASTGQPGTGMLSHTGQHGRKSLAPENGFAYLTVIATDRFFSA